MPSRNQAALLTLLLCSCGVDASRIADHTLVADDGDRIVLDRPVVFAVVGNTRDAVPGLDRAMGNNGVQSGVNDAIFADIATSAASGGPQFVALVGDMVRQSTTAEWKTFSGRTVALLDGATPPEGKVNTRLRALPVAGDREAANDSRYTGFDGAFPGVGATIGYNRVATWYTVDVVAGNKTWRIVALDSSKDELGSRWAEQLGWIKSATDGKYDFLIVMMHESLYSLSGRPDSAMNRDGAPAELIGKVEDTMVEPSKLRAVITAGNHASEVMLPDGPFGALQLGVGGGGAPASDLRRWGAAEQAGREADLALEPMFDVALQERVTSVFNQDGLLPETVIDQARARNSFEGFVGTYASQYVPTYGWWQLTLYGTTMDAAFHAWNPGGSFSLPYRVTWVDGVGWQGKKL
jgi:hypothetical protein